MKQQEEQSSQYDDEIDLFELWNGLVEEKLTILVTLFASIFIAAIYVFLSDDVYQASAKVQVQQVQLQKGEEAKPYVSIEPAAKTAEMFSGISAASLSAVKKVDGVLIVTSQGPDKTAIKENVEATIKLVEERHAKIFNALSSSGVKSVLPTEMIGTVVVTNHPIKPKRGLILAVAGVLGLMLGIFIALIRRAAKNRKEVVNL